MLAQRLQPRLAKDVTKGVLGQQGGPGCDRATRSHQGRGTNASNLKGFHGTEASGPAYRVS